MPKLRGSSSGAPPVIQLSEEFYCDISEIVCLPLDNEIKKQFQEIVDNVLAWGILDKSAESAPIIKFYRKLEKKLNAVSELIDHPKIESNDAMFYARHCYDESRLPESPSLVDLLFICQNAARNLKAAEKNLMDNHVVESKPGPNPPQWLSRLITKLCVPAMRLGLSIGAHHNDYVQEGDAPRESSFVKFVDRFRAEIEKSSSAMSELPADPASTISAVRRTLGRIKAQTAAKDNPKN